MTRNRLPRRFFVALLTVALVGSALTTGVSAAGDLTVDPTPSGPNEAESTHALTVTVNADDAVVGAPMDDVFVDYSQAQPTADVSNVGVGQIERVGIDRNDDDPGTQIDVSADRITEVSGARDGAAVRIGLAGNHTIEAGDEVVVVLQNVQNPQNAGTASVELMVNTQGAATSATGPVTYDRHDAAVTFDDQSSAGDAVTVDDVSLTEGGFVALQNVSGADSAEIRGTSAHLSPGTHTDVRVPLDVDLSSDADLTAQVYTDTDADRRFDYTATGGEVDGPYRNVDDNLIGTDAAAITYDADAETATPTETATATETTSDDDTDTATTTETSTDEETDAETASDGSSRTTATDGDDPTDTADADVTETVADDETATTDEGAETTGGTGPGFGVVAALLGLVASVALRRR